MKKIAFLLAILAIPLSACNSKSGEKAQPEQGKTAPEAETKTGTDKAAEPGAPAGEPNIVGEEVSYAQGEVTMKGFLAYDAAREGKRPGVLVVHEWWGHNEYARKRARMLAELGYTALAVDMYGDGQQAHHPKEAQELVAEVTQSMDVAKGRFLAALETLRKHESTDPDRIAAIGYCFGGSIVLHMARFGIDLDGVVSFHGGLSTDVPAKMGEVKASVLVCHGGADTFVPEAEVEAFKKEMALAGVDYTFKVYEGATHAFTSPEADEHAKNLGLPIAYHPEADKESWAEMQRFFDRIFEKK